MAEFRHTTQLGKNPRGMQKVYFTCHPDDFDSTFTQIKKEIFARQDVAIWYLDPNIKPEDVEDYELQLGLMNLFVVPVTAKLLNTPNRAMDTDVPFAVKRHIPILPLMLESDLDTVFNKKFGDLQYLDKSRDDPTAIPYDTKLTRYLESVIIGSELVEKVRAAFDAYVFLSYRKKDRLYAQEMMRLIHKDEKYRDVAIWYDEYLTPGEDFNKSIEDALKKSDVFALMVTPSLVNEVNYITELEYPKAKTLNKPILPIEMAPTDQKKLKKMYKGCSAPISPKKAQKISKLLAAFLKNIALTESDDPEHNYLIGLAYLSGIDVEIDHKRSIKLIVGSAEKGYTPAIEKAVSIYNNGEGVQRDYQEAIRWQKELIERRKMDYDNHPDEKKAFDLMFSLWELGSAYKALSQYSAAREAVLDMYDYTESFSVVFEDDKFVRYHAISCDMLGDIAKSMDRPEEASEYFCESLDVNEERAHALGTTAAYRDLVISYVKMGDICLELGRLNEAESWYIKELALEETLAKNPEHLQDNASLGNSKLGEIALMRGEYDKAEEYYRKALGIVKSLAEESDKEWIRSDISQSYIKLGDIAYAQEDIQKAKEWFELALEAVSVLDEETEKPLYKQSLSVLYERIGNICKHDGNYSEAAAWYRKMLAVNEELVQITEDTEDRRGLAISYEKLGITAFEQGNIAETEAWYRKALRIREEIADETKTYLSYDHLANSYHNLGWVLKDQSLLEKAMNIWLNLGEQCPEVRDYKRKAAKSYYAIMQLQGKL